jgi:mannosyltransferase
VTEPWSSRMFRLGLVFALAVGAVTILLQIGERPFWRDEVASVSVAERSFGGVLDVLPNHDANHGLYYLLLHLWMRGGQSEGWVRGLSALFALAAIPATGLLARRLFGDAVGLLAALLSAANAFIATYAQEARGYALALLLVTLSTWLLVEAVRSPRWTFVGGYAAISILAVYANLFSALVLVAHVVCLPFVPGVRRWGRRFLVAFGIILAGTVPFAAFLAATANDQVTWIPRPAFGSLSGFAREIAGSRPLAIAYGLAAMIGLAPGWRRPARTVQPDGDGRWRSILLAGWLALPPLALFAVSLAKPLFVPRYLVGSVPALTILGAAGLVALMRHSRTAGLGVAAILLALSLVARLDAHGEGTEDLRAAARLVAREAQPGDGMAFAPAFARPGMRWYLEREAHPPPPVDLAVGPRGTAEQVGDLYAREISTRALIPRIRRYRRVWLAGYPSGADGWHPTPEPMLRGGVTVLQREYRLVRSRNYGIRVLLYDRKAKTGRPPARASLDRNQ